MAGKICMITGANSGIGLVTARELADRGAALVLVCRDRARGEAALAEIKARSGNDGVELMLCDLASQRSIREFAEEFKRTHDRLDVLVNNAGVYIRNRTVVEGNLETTFAVNHLAYFLLTNLLLDVIEPSASARIINVASGAHTYGRMDFDNLQGEKSYSGVRAYTNSKLANVLFTYELARRLKATSVTANCLHPGAVATSIFRALPKFVESLIKMMTLSPEKGAETSIHLAASPEVEGVTGKYFVKKTETRSSPESYNEDTARKLWTVSERLTGLEAT
jgi:NAD(P)-dependent dehydrogenase (short-subunit alcohol dehydrogenase family)